MPAMSLSAFLGLASVCATLVAPETIASVVSTESAFDPLAIGVNRGCAKPPKAGTAAEATALAEAMVARGCDPDLGIAQINVRAGHLQKRGLPISAAFDRKVGLRVGCEVLAECFRSAPGADSQLRLRRALGCYNTGRHDENAPYVTRVQASAEALVPAIRTSTAAKAPEARPGKKETPAYAVRAVPASRKRTD